MQLYPLIRNATKRKNDTSFQKKQYDAKFVCLMENNRSKCSSGHTELNISNMSVSGFLSETLLGMRAYGIQPVFLTPGKILS